MSKLVVGKYKGVNGRLWIRPLAHLNSDAMRAPSPLAGLDANKHVGHVYANWHQMTLTPN